MVTPALLVVLVLGMYPMLDSLRISVLQYDLLRIANEGTPFVGLQNYITIFNDARFIKTLINTIAFVIIAVSVVVTLGLFLAQVLNMNFRGRGVVRMIVLVPWFIPPVVASMVWIWIFQTDRSPINHILRELGLITSNIGFLTNTDTVGPVSIPMLAVSSVRVWNGLPFVVIFLLAGLQSLPHELYEAAEIDGANRVQRFLYITLPLLRPVLSILITLLAIGGIGHFEFNYIMTGGGPRDLTNIMAVLSYQQAFVFHRFDFAAAISGIILLLTGPIAVIYIYNQIKDR
jgi:ABC-type sugar transport system permease subunit